MLKQLRLVSAMDALALIAIATSPAMGASAVATGAEELVGKFWTAPVMKSMDKNKDGMVSREEFMNYMGAQFDMMDQNKDKMLSTKEFMDSKMMKATFPPGDG